MVYNLGIHNCKDESARMNVWHEAQASTVAQEVASALCKYICDKADHDKTELVAWSDSCGDKIVI